MGRPLDKDRNHKISLKAAAAAARRFRRAGPGRNGVAGAFLATAIRELIDQAGCAGVRIYLGENEARESELILVGVDDNGNDMTQGILLDANFPCPPYCPDDNELNS